MNPLALHQRFLRAALTATLLAAASCCSAAVQASPSEPETPPPTHADVRYGDGTRQKLHFWQAESDEPTGVVVHFHGGGWNGGQRLNKNLKPLLPKLLEAGIAVASVQYRFIKHGVSEGVFPPVKAPLSDAARAVQFVRTKAEDWNLDPERLGVFGGSAGGCTSLWLAFHDNIANPESDDPVERESTRPNVVAVLRAQTTLDPLETREWMPDGYYGSHAFGIIRPGKEHRQRNMSEFLARRQELLPEINEYSPYALATSDAPPIYLFYKQRPAMGEKTRDPTHSANYGVGLQKKLHSLGVPCELVYPGASDVEHATIAEYLIAKLN